MYLKELIEERNDIKSDIDDWLYNEGEKPDRAYFDRLDYLDNIISEVLPYSRYGEESVRLIPDDEFTEHAIELLKDVGILPPAIPWYVVIDEEATADNIKQDYSSIEIDGVLYWYR